MVAESPNVATSSIIYPPPHTILFCETDLDCNSGQLQRGGQKCIELLHGCKKPSYFCFEKLCYITPTNYIRLKRSALKSRVGSFRSRVGSIRSRVGSLRSRVASSRSRVGSSRSRTRDRVNYQRTGSTRNTGRSSGMSRTAQGRPHALRGGRRSVAFDPRVEYGNSYFIKYLDVI